MEEKGGRKWRGKEGKKNNYLEPGRRREEKREKGLLR